MPRSITEGDHPPSGWSACSGPAGRRVESAHRAGRARAMVPVRHVVDGGVWRVGAKLEFPFPKDVIDMTLKGEVLVVDEPHSLAYTWGGDTLRFELHDRDGGTWLVLIDELPKPHGRAERSGLGDCLDRLLGLDATPTRGRGRFARTTPGLRAAARPTGGAPGGLQGRSDPPAAGRSSVRSNANLTIPVWRPRRTPTTFHRWPRCWSCRTGISQDSPVLNRIEQGPACADPVTSGCGADTAASCSLDGVDPHRVADVVFRCECGAYNRPDPVAAPSRPRPPSTPAHVAPPSCHGARDRIAHRRLGRCPSAAQRTGLRGTAPTTTPAPSSAAGSRSSARCCRPRSMRRRRDPSVSSASAPATAAT